MTILGALLAGAVAAGAHPGPPARAAPRRRPPVSRPPPRTAAAQGPGARPRPGETALIQAAVRGREAAIRQLLAARAAVDAQDTYGGSGRGLAVQGLRRRGPAWDGERIAGALVLVPILEPVLVSTLLLCSSFFPTFLRDVKPQKLLLFGGFEIQYFVKM